MKTASGDALRPVQESERIQALDILRGFALFGILIVNITHYLDWFAPYASRADTIWQRCVVLFAVNKFYALFSFLFGVGFAIQLTRARTRQTPFLGVYLRRLTVLFVIGVAFYVFVERELILITYAALGAPLLLFRTRSPRVLLAWAVVFLVFTPFTRPVQTAMRRLLYPPPAQVQTGAVTERAARYQTREVQLEEASITGPYRALVAARASRLLETLTFLIGFSYWPRIFAMFLLGFYAHRRGVFQDLDANRRFIRHTLYWSAGVGFGGTFAIWSLGPTIRATPWLSVVPLEEFVGTGLTISYIAAIVLLLRWGAARRALNLLGWTGRMGLTNYVLHFLIVTVIFYGYGFGLYYGLGQSMGPVFTLLITLVPIPLSVWWLRRFRFGPLEWIWRSLTYSRRQPMLIPPAQRSTARAPYLRGAVAAIAVLKAGVALAVWEPADLRRSDEAEIAKLENEWRSAELSADTATLGRIAADDYEAQRGNPLGITNLPQLMESIATGTLRFDAITRGGVTVVAHEFTGSASGLETQDVSLHGRSVGGERRYVHWYAKRDGRWRLAFSYLARR